VEGGDASVAFDAATAASTTAADAATQTILTQAPGTIVGVGFVAAVVALTLVTGGVSYLTFLSWRDARDEKAAAEADAAAERRRCVLAFLSGRCVCASGAASALTLLLAAARR
jgi:hypothetical protein